MTGTALVMAAALSTLVQQTPSLPPPLPPSPPAPRPDVREMVFPPPRAVCRMPVVRGDNRADPKFVMAPEPSVDVRFSIRRTPGQGEKPECPDPLHPKRE